MPKIKISDDVTINVHEHGAGAPTYLLIHGWAFSGGCWKHVMTDWPESAGRVLAPDLRGTGASERPGATAYTLADYVNDVVRLLDVMQLSDVVLVGHSMGGVIAQAVALERHAALRQMILLAPAPACGVEYTGEQVEGFRGMYCNGTDDEPNTEEQAMKLAGAILGSVIHNVASVPEERMRELERDMMDVCRDAFVGGLDAWRNASFSDQLGEIKVPTRVILGGEEQLFPEEMQRREVVDRIPGATLELLPDVGHCLIGECPELVRERILQATG